LNELNEDARFAGARRFAEEVGIFSEEYGLPRMAGRVLGWLLVSDPPNQSLAELSEALMASKGSVSTMTRLLIQLGMVERVSLPGLRRDYFCIKGDENEAGAQFLAKTVAMRRLSERGLELMEGKPPRLRERLERTRDLCAFLEKEVPLLVQRWERERAKGGSQAG